MITGLFHTCFTVADLDRSIDFYTNIIGMKLYKRIESTGETYRVMTCQPRARVRMAYLEMDGRFLELIEYLEGGSGYADFDFGQVRATHVAFFANDVRQTYAELKARGVEFLSEVQTAASGRSAVYFRDPDGNILELCEPL